MTMAALRTLLLACFLGLAGCASVPPPATTQAGAPACLPALRVLDDAVAAAGVADGGAARIDGFPQLRVDRFVASLASERLESPQSREWVERMASLGRRGHAVELANLPPASRISLEQALHAAGEGKLESLVERCAEELTARDLASPERLATLRARARVPDDYDTWKRVVGLYWVTRLAFANGIENWHEEVRAAFSQPQAGKDPRQVAYTPPKGRVSGSEARAILARSVSGTLGIHEPKGDDAEALYRAFAPTFIVAQGSAADVPGEPGFIGGIPGIARSAPVVYRRMSHARLGSQDLLQLDYWLWFPERPKASGWDLLGGALDAVLWRVTLTPDAEPWVYDTVHACGCYHLFFPTGRALAKPQPETLDETAFVPQRLPRMAAGTPVEVYIEAGTHYVHGVAAADTPREGIPYEFREDDSLRSLALADGTRASLFRPDGIVAGTERGERWLFWPMGIREPGAMRQWGRHATAFVGRRHFDDPGLIPQYFELH